MQNYYAAHHNNAIFSCTFLLRGIPHGSRVRLIWNRQMALLSNALVSKRLCHRLKAPADYNPTAFDRARVRRVQSSSPAPERAQTTRRMRLIAKRDLHVFPGIRGKKS